MDAGVEVVALTGEQVLAGVDRVVTVYRRAFNDAISQSAEEFGERTIPRHARRPGFRCRVAYRAGELVGFAYGYTGQRGQWWSDWVASQAPAVVVDTWLGGHFEFVELAVTPREQGRGVGGALHDALLSGTPHDRALLTTYRDDRPATRLYRSRGWTILVPGLSSDFDLYGRKLPF